MPCPSDPSIFGYISALGCVVRYEISETYTALSIVIGLLTVGWWVHYFLSQHRLTKNGLPTAFKSFLRDTRFVFAAVAIYAIAVAPYTLYIKLSEENAAMRQRANTEASQEKKELLTMLLDLIEQGRKIETMMSFTTSAHPAVQQEIDSWNAKKERIEIVLQGTRYRSYVAYLAKESATLADNMQRIKEISEKIQKEDMASPKDGER